MRRANHILRKSGFSTTFVLRFWRCPIIRYIKQEQQSEIRYSEQQSDHALLRTTGQSSDTSNNKNCPIIPYSKQQELSDHPTLTLQTTTVRSSDTPNNNNSPLFTNLHRRCTVPSGTKLNMRVFEWGLACVMSLLGGACGTCGKDERRGQDYGGKTEGKRLLEILGVLWNMIIKRIFNRFGGRGFE